MSPALPTKLAVRVSGVSKIYRIYDRPQDRLKQMLLGRFGRSWGSEFWALRDVSFEVCRGEAVGVIGRNGSGKSTLLQIIAGTLAPTSGEVEVVGRVAALLELGSGFNPEFTGRENVFLNGAILGMSRADVERRFDDIAAFADIGAFIEQPTKLYSSGMVVRLAFAVQAFSQPDLLIVDEALAVGDIYFQHKCMRHIQRLVAQGTSLLFVSHSSEAIKRFCQRGLWLDGGEARFFGQAGAAVERYLAHTRMRERQSWDEQAPDLPDDIDPIADTEGLADPEDAELRQLFRRDPQVGTQVGEDERYGNQKARITAVELLDEQGDPVSEAVFGQCVRLRISAERVAPKVAGLEFSFIVRDRNRVDLFGTTTTDEQLQVNGRARQFVVEFAFTVHLGPGSYSILAACVECSPDLTWRQPADQIDIAYVFSVAFAPHRPVWYMFHEPVSVRGAAFDPPASPPS
jgi:lipopolysaccharide transport system ATP-binding protein